MGISGKVCWFALFAIMALLLMSGCTTVRANQKQRLADPIMTFDHDQAQTEMMGHILTPREGAIGGFSSTGAGGCGCN
jgi:hypothetical protein